MLYALFDNFSHNLFKPLLLFFYAGFSIPLLGIGLEFPKVLYQGLTIYLLLAIGWHGGEELAGLSPAMLGQACGFMALGFVTNTVIGVAAYWILRSTTRLRQVDAATVAGYYGSDSAGTFVTCLGVLAAGQIAFAPYMPVLLAVMEIPGCLVALVLVSRMRRRGIDQAGNMPGEPGYAGTQSLVAAPQRAATRHAVRPLRSAARRVTADEEAHELVGAGAGTAGRQNGFGRHRPPSGGGKFGKFAANGRIGDYEDDEPSLEDRDELIDIELVNADEGPPLDVTLMQPSNPPEPNDPQKHDVSIGRLFHEVFLNPGTFLLFAGLAIGFISRLQGEQVVAKNDALFVSLFQGMLCLFLLEMGMTAAQRLKDLKHAGWQFVAFALLAPNLFAGLGIGMAHLYSMWLGQPFDLGTYALFAVLCGAASYIAVPALQRMAIPEASPTLPLAASLGLTFSYNVTVGIPVYLLAATALTSYFPVVAAG